MNIITLKSKHDEAEEVASLLLARLEKSLYKIGTGVRNEFREKEQISIWTPFYLPLKPKTILKLVISSAWFILTGNQISILG